ncbi:pre-mRNA 3'-end-processing factor FIP1 isoform X2 [Mugil cephalus]|uniref:pre-mRNA 3'-end-processing factor FIP1 isoform X2 n=1 Tax=Mugil cephalus TaxID=48193 RepID=UPI001FB63DB2|nr:pre-mRNA 3'-end-processing factor FIP1 isoform X2 [Mugil cephalus]
MKMSALELDFNAISKDEEEENTWSNDNNTPEDRNETDIIQAPSSSGHTHELFKTNAERRTQSSGATKEQDVDALENIQGTEVHSPSPETIENKPWMKPGANISDYFNYGFDEESWDAYCKRQTTLCEVNGKPFPKLLPQMWKTVKEEEQPCCAYSSFARPASRDKRASSAASNVTGGHAGSNTREKGWRCLSHSSNTTQVVTEMSHKADLPPPSNTFAFISPPPFLFRSGPPASSPSTILNSGHSKDLTSSYPQSSESMAVNVGMIDTAKAWECYMWQLKCDKDRDKAREQGRNKDRNIKKESRSSAHNSGEEQLKHRDTVEQGQKRRSSVKDSGEKRHKSEGWHKTSQSRNRRDDDEDRDTNIKAKRSRTKSNKMFSADQKRKLKSY